MNQLQEWYKEHFENNIAGRRIILEDIESIILSLPKIFKVAILGKSEQNRNIYKITYGVGTKKILTWSQMHGNESTGTKALFDYLKFLTSDDHSQLTTKIYNECTLVFIPMLNPDGAIQFTRVNANDIDLNRDAVNLVAKESNLLRNELNTFNPQFCFNLHDQRSIFNVDGFNNPATISFLAPSVNEERTITAGRKETMSVIVAMNDYLQKIIPNHIGRYTDEFYPTATGDNFQKLGHNTILIEAGHYYNDYEREKVREFNFYALVTGINYILKNQLYQNHDAYFEIPNNNTKFFDFILRNVKDDQNKQIDIAFQYEYEVVNNKLVSKLIEHKRGDLKDYVGYNEIY